MKNMLKKIRKTSERGQAIILIAASIVGLVAIVGLMIDGGILLIEYARLKRGIDAASIAAASQFRKDFTGDEMKKAGEEFLKFNQSESDVTIYTCSCPPNTPDADHDGDCDGDPDWPLDQQLCPPFIGTTSRKLVRITASRYVDFGFMRVIGMNGTWIKATAVGEAASIDMVLAIDTSSSMAYETTTTAEDPESNPQKTDPARGTSTGDDPDICNAAVRVNKEINPAAPGYAAYQAYLAQRCEPMGKVKDAAVDFIDQLFYPYDRVSVVSFTKQIQDGTATRMPEEVIALNDNQAAVQAAIYDLKVFRPRNCPDPLTSTDLGPCLRYDSSAKYLGQTCGALTNGGIDPTSCGASNIGSGLNLAGDQFGNGARTNSFWVVIALIGGPANAAVPRTADGTTADANQGLCPGSATNPTWQWPDPASPGNYLGTGFCRDRDPMPYVLATNPRRAKPTVDNSTIPPTTTYPPNYDADDFARDAADYIASPTNGQGATLFAICLGEYCQNYFPTLGDPYSAEHLGQYMALNAGDNLTVIPNVRANHGLYFCAECTHSSSSLTGVFDKIAENIFTRISQ
jgi:hypothetical protein